MKRGQRQKPEGPRERRVGRPRGACQPREEGPLGSEARSPEGEEAASRDTVELRWPAVPVCLGLPTNPPFQATWGGWPSQAEERPRHRKRQERPSWVCLAEAA